MATQPPCRPGNRRPKRPVLAAGVLLLAIAWPVATSALALVGSGILADIQRSSTLRVCVVTDYAGVTMRDSRTGRLSGIDIDMSKRLAMQLRVGVAYFETTFLAFPGDLAARRCHIAMMGIWISENRQRLVDFSEPYATSGAYVAVARANRQLPDWAAVDRPTTMLAVVDTPDLRHRADRILPRATKVPATHSEPMKELMAGRADAVIVDYAMANSLGRSANWARIIAPPAPVLLTEIAYAVPKGEPDWLRRVNHFVRTIKQDGSLRQAVDRHGLSGLGIPR